MDKLGDSFSIKNCLKDQLLHQTYTQIKNKLHRIVKLRKMRHT